MQDPVKTAPGAPGALAAPTAPTASSAPRELRFEAQRIAFGPMMFHAAMLLRDLGLLAALKAAHPTGLTASAVAAKAGISAYGARVLLEAGLGMDLVHLAALEDPEGPYRLAPLGAVFLQDPMTRANADFVRDVCYRGMADLGASIREARPAGLEAFGAWPTIYEGLSQLPPKVQESWFRFDHYYSDSAFPAVLPLVFRARPRRLLDVGGNTGRFALQCVRHDPDVQVTLLDLPGQLAKAAENVAAAGFSGRIGGHPLDLLDATQPFPGGFDAVWMSQFLCCFPEEDIVHLLRRGAAALNAGGSLYVLDTYWDRQKTPAAAYCLQATSLYFTALANGTSRMYHSRDLLRCVDAAGLVVEEDVDGLGISHTLFRCRVR
ncbi:methyltransferase [Chondromyces apiculatus]|uniref:SAM-dependent methyltransferase n=1 Tax=Chondromyces apiculatus DSM 436 TaxID=1192034 RepID=A0A017TCV8_9BACT|nr:methyltransferase [Chondromyces apiculatus]EYF06767.1 SAM-dependent methyltransferase [Chondromyces apiculatus DSM 436]